MSDKASDKGAEDDNPEEDQDNPDDDGDSSSSDSQVFGDVFLWSYRLVDELYC